VAQALRDLAPSISSFGYDLPIGLGVLARTAGGRNRYLDCLIPLKWVTLRLGPVNEAKEGGDAMKVDRVGMAVPAVSVTKQG